MADGRGQDRRSGGSLLAAAIIVGAVAGTIAGQPSIGWLGGLGAGLLLLGGVWLADRRRRTRDQAGASGGGPPPS